MQIYDLPDDIVDILINDEIYKEMPDSLKSMYLYYKIESISKIVKFEKMKKRYKKDVASNS